MCIGQFLIDKAPILSISMPLIGIGIAWIIFIVHQHGILKAKKSKKKSFLESIAAEFDNMKPWVLTKYKNDRKFYWNHEDAQIQSWKNPLQRIQYVFPHNAIQSAAKDGIDRGLSPNLVIQLIELEQAIIVFEQAVQLCEKVSSDYPQESLRLSEYLGEYDPRPLTKEEEAVERLSFNQFFHLHAECIGEYSKGRNLHSSYIRTRSLLEKEFADIDTDKQWKLRFWYFIPLIFPAIGLDLIASLFF